MFINLILQHFLFSEKLDIVKETQFPLTKKLVTKLVMDHKTRNLMIHRL